MTPLAMQPQPQSQQPQQQPQLLQTPPPRWTNARSQALLGLVEHERERQWRALEQANPILMPQLPLDTWRNLPLDDAFAQHGGAVHVQSS